MTRFDYRRAFFVSAGLLALLLTAGGAYLLGSIRVYSTNQAAGNSLVDQLPQVLHADSASGGKTVSTATGRLDENTECLFVLDHQTGVLSCLIINPRTATTGGVYVANVATQLQLDKLGDLDFVMVTGYNAFGIAGVGGILRPASCLCYVVEGNSGRAVAYSLSYNRTALQQGAVQQGALEVVWQGVFRQEALKRN
ncbi:MAG: hypothetical protein ACK49R_17600 [Planctomycetota bacterium]|jgi:hypothetical protein